MQEYNLAAGILMKSKDLFLDFFEAINKILKEYVDANNDEFYKDNTILPSLEMTLDDGSKIEIAKVDDVNFNVFVRQVKEDRTTDWQKIQYEFDNTRNKRFNFQGNSYYIKDFSFVKNKTFYEKEVYDSCAFFQDYCKEKGHSLVGVILNKESCELINKYRSIINYDLLKLSEEEFSKKYGNDLPLYIEGNNGEKRQIDYDFPFYLLEDGPLKKLFVTGDELVSLKYLVSYIASKHKEFGSEIVVEKNIKELFEKYDDKFVEILVENDNQREVICNELQVNGIDFSINYHQDSYGIVFPKTCEKNGITINNEDLVLNIIDKSPYLSVNEKTHIIVECEKNLNDREASVKQYRKAIEIKR